MPCSSDVRSIWHAFLYTKVNQLIWWFSMLNGFRIGQHIRQIPGMSKLKGTFGHTVFIVTILARGLFLVTQIRWIFDLHWWIHMQNRLWQQSALRPKLALLHQNVAWHAAGVLKIFFFAKKSLGCQMQQGMQQSSQISYLLLCCCMPCHIAIRECQGWPKRGIDTSASSWAYLI